MQWNDLQLFSSMTNGNLAHTLDIPTEMTGTAHRPMNYQLKIARTERSHNNLFRNFQVVNKVLNGFEIGNGLVLEDQTSLQNFEFFSISSSTKITRTHIYGSKTVDSARKWAKMVKTIMGNIPSVSNC